MHTELDRGKAIMLSRPGIFGVEASTLLYVVSPSFKPRDLKQSSFDSEDI